MRPEFVPVILCGGAGSRLWPYSRQLLPKPFVRLPDGATMLGAVLESLRGCSCPQGVIVAGTPHAALCEQAVQAAQLPWPVTVVAEPRSCGTAAAAALAALQVKHTAGAAAVLAIMPADRHVEDPAKFTAAVQAAAGAAAAQDRLAVLGIEPTEPAERFGYVLAEPGDAEVLAAARFVEKPSAAKARELLAQGSCYWNAGVFVASAGVYLRLLREHCPQIAKQLEPLAGSVPAAGAAWAVPEKFGADMEPLSIDVGIAERAAGLLLVPARGTGWRDLGDWDDFAKLFEPDEQGNRRGGRAVLAQARNVSVLAQSERLVAVAGCSDLHVIDTDDAVLVCGPNSAGAVRELHAQLLQDQERSVTSPPAEQRPWGNYRRLGGGGGWQVKRIEVDPGCRLSLQSHRHRSELWTVVQGQITAQVGERRLELGVGECCHIPQGARHRMENCGDVPAVVVEVQTGAYLGEDDIERYEDDFGRR